VWASTRVDRQASDERAGVATVGVVERVAVVGAGTAGCLVADRLADDSRHVTLVEAGDLAGERSATASSLDDLAVPGAIWPGEYVRGRGLGGSSRVNGAVLSGPWPGWLPVETVGDDELGPLDRCLLDVPGAERVTLLRRGGRLLSTADVGRGLAGAVEPEAGREAVRLLFAGRRVRGVELADGTAVDADRVVVCCGAIGSAALLLRSGLVGAGLGDVEDHAARVIDLRLADEVDPASLVTGVAVRRGGIELVPLNHVGAALPGRAALIAGWLGSPRRGRVGPDGTVGFGPLDDVTAAGVGAAVAWALELLASERFAGLFVDEPEVATVTGGYFHACGSCRSIVDHRGAVVGYDGLYVADASVLPLPPHGPMGAVIARAVELSLP